MLTLIDECIPKNFAALLVGHEVYTVAQRGWAGKKNGDLLALAVNAKFDAFLTIDQNLSYQQNLKGSHLRIITTSTHSSHLSALRPLVPRVLKALQDTSPGDLATIR